MTASDRHDHITPYIRQKRERIFSELRQGRQVIIRDRKGKAALLRAAEFADFPVHLPADTGYSAENLCLTPTIIQALGRSVSADTACFSLPAGLLSEAEILSLAIGENIEEGQLTHLLAEKTDSLCDIGCRLLRAAKLLPSALVARLIDSSPPSLGRLAQHYQLVSVDFHEIKEITRPRNPTLIISSRAKLPLSGAADSEIVMFREEGGTEEHFAVIVGASAGQSADTPPLVRLHSQCVTGDVLGSLKCDCGQQLKQAISLMNEAGYGILIYLEQEGRDIGLLNKNRAYALQDKGLDTVDANHRLGFDTDERVFAPAAAILKALNVSAVNLLTNNPDKVEQLSSFGIEIASRVGLVLESNPFNEHYMNVKRDRTGHYIPESGTQ